MARGFQRLVMVTRPRCFRCGGLVRSSEVGNGGVWDAMTGEFGPGEDVDSRRWQNSEFRAPQRGWMLETRTMGS